MPPAVRVFKYGVHYKWTRQLPDHVREQLFLAHQVREDLVSLEIAHEQAVRDVWSSYPEVAETERQLAEADLRAQELAEKVSAERSRQRTKRIAGPLTGELKDARATLKAARQARREAIAAVAAKPEVKDALSDLRTELKRDRYALYAIYVQGQGLYHATYNTVVRQHVAAVQRIGARRRAGQPAQLRHHRFDGTGTISVDLLRQAGQPQRTPARLADGVTGRWRNVVYLPALPPDFDDLTRAEQRRSGRVTARLRIGSNEITHVDLPLQMHRQIPADADVTGVKLVVTKVGGQMRAHLNVIARVSDPEPVQSGPAVAVHMGWRSTDDGATAVATWRSDAPLEIPAGLEGVIRHDRPRTSGTIALPARIADRVARHDKTASERGLAFDRVKADLVEWLKACGPVAHPMRPDQQITSADAARWRSPGRIAILALAWRQAPPTRPDGASITEPAGVSIAQRLEEWRAHDKMRWISSEHGRRKAIGTRDDLWRQVAAVISDQARVLVVDDMDITALASIDNPDLPSEVQEAINHRRLVAAPGALRAALRQAAIRDGVKVIDGSAAGLSRTHHRCGHVNPSDGRYMQRPVLCDGCGATYDPDESATHILLDMAEGGGG